MTSKSKTIRAILLMAVGSIFLLKGLGVLPDLTPVFKSLHIVGPIVLIGFGARLLYKSNQKNLANKL